MGWYSFLTVLFIPLVSFAGETPHHITAFIGNSGQSDTLVSYTYYSTHHFWNKNGKQLETFNTFRGQDYALYSEYAIVDTDSISIQGGYASTQESLNGNSRGIMDGELSWKHLLCGSENSALTSRLTLIVPVDDLKSSIRYGKWGGQFDFLYSAWMPICGLSSWYDLSLGYRGYQKGPSDQMRISGALGICFTDSLSLIGSTQLEYGVFNGNSSFNFNPVVFAPNYRLLNVQIECLYQTCANFYLTLGGFKHAWGQNVGSGGVFFGGIWMVF